MNLTVRKEIGMITDCVKIHSIFYTAQSGYKIAHLIYMYPSVSFFLAVNQIM